MTDRRRVVVPLVHPTDRMQPSTTEEAEAKRTSQIAKLARLIERLQSSHYFGELTIVFQDGLATAVRTGQHIRIDELG